MSNTDRDPADAAAVGKAVLEWMAAASDEADIALEKVLLAQGVINADEAITDINYDDRATQATGPMLFIQLEDIGFSVSGAGVVTIEQE